MLHLHRRHVLRTADAGRASTSLIAPGLRVGLVRSWGLPSFDARPLQAAVGQFVHAGEPLTELVLEGSLVVFDAEGARTFGPGSIVRRAWSGWNERWEGDVQVVSAYAPGGGRPLHASAGQLGRRSLLRLRALAARAERGETVDSFVDAVLREIEWPAARARSTPPPELQLLATRLGALLSRLWDQPQLVDLSEEMGLSIRQVRRHLRAAEPWLGLYGSAAGWRSQLHRIRLVAAVAFLASPRCRLTEIARDVGYGSPRGMLTAFERAGLPAPAVLRRAL